MTHVQGLFNYRAMKKFALGCYLLLAQFCNPLFCQSESEEDRTCQSYNSAMQIVSQLRDLEFRKNVRCRALNSKQFQEIFSDRIEPQIDSERLAYEGMVYKILGFIPNDFDYSRCILESYLSETAAFYRPEKNDYIVNTSQQAGLATAVHELTHALQQQHFAIKRPAENAADSSDLTMAKSALIEGDAVRIEEMLPVMQQQAPILKTALAIQNNNVTLLRPCKMPVTIEALMGFAYEKGQPFVEYLVKRGGNQLLNLAFRTPPIATSDILHPEQYIGRILTRGKQQSSQNLIKHQLDGTEIFSDSLGEFFIETLLRFYIQKNNTANLAAHVRDDRVTLFQENDGKKRLIWTTLWNSNENSKLFAETLLQITLNRFKNGNVREGDRRGAFIVPSFGEVVILSNSARVDFIFESNSSVLTLRPNSLLMIPK